MIRLALGAGAVVFVIVLSAHAGHAIWQESHVAAQWVQIGGGHSAPIWTRYLERGDVWLGYAYALSAGFTTFALVLTLSRRRSAAAGALGGITFLGILYAAGCFLIGCCGSPMLTVYLSLFGASVLGLLKPIVALITTLSVGISGVLLTRRACAPDCTTCQPDARLTSIGSDPSVP